MADAKQSGSRARRACRLSVAWAVSGALGFLSIAAAPAVAAAARTETPIPANMVTRPSTTGSSARTAALSVPAGRSFSGLVNIGGGRKMYLECMGQGSPTVIRSVAGMVLLDAFPAVIAQLLGSSWLAYLSILNAVPPGLEHYKALEYLNFGASFHQVLGARPLPRMPLVVLSHSPSHPFVLPPNAPPGLSKKLETAWAKGQDYLASLEPSSVHIIANTDHYIQTADPQVVVQSTRTVVDGARLKG